MTGKNIFAYKYACGQTIVFLLREGTTGNSPTALCHSPQEPHSEEWMRKQLCYLSHCQRHKAVSRRWDRVHQSTHQQFWIPTYQNSRGFLAVYVQEDVWSLLAQVVSTYGTVLKVDPTKKVCKKLQGAATL